MTFDTGMSKNVGYPGASRSDSATGNREIHHQSHGCLNNLVRSYSSNRGVCKRYKRHSALLIRSWNEIPSISCMKYTITSPILIYR